jgi:hypothetical protein
MQEKPNTINPMSAARVNPKAVQENKDGCQNKMAAIYHGGLMNKLS